MNNTSQTQTAELSHLERWQLAKELIAASPKHNPNHVSQVYYWLQAVGDKRNIVERALEWEAVGGDPMTVINVWQHTACSHILMEQANER